MPFRAADLIKRHIVQVNTGLIVGHVEDLVVNPELQQVVALVTISPRWKREATVIPWSHVRIASGDVILVEAGSEPEPISSYPEFQTLIERRIRLNGTPVISETGMRYGSVHDLLLEDDGLIIGYILSYGFLGADRRYVAAGAVKAIGPDAILALDGALRELGDAHQPISPRLILPFTGTPISLDEVEEVEHIEAQPSLMGLPEPAPTPPNSPNEMLGDLPDTAVAEGEALVAHPPAEPPPVTSQESAGEMLLDVAPTALAETELPLITPQAAIDEEHHALDLPSAANDDEGVGEESPSIDEGVGEESSPIVDEAVQVEPQPAFEESHTFEPDPEPKDNPPPEPKRRRRRG